MGAYLPPSSLHHLPDLEAALSRYPNLSLMLFGDLNTDLTQLTITCSRTIAASLSACGLRDLLHDFRQRCPYRDYNTWHQLRLGVHLKSQCDYILGTDRRLVQYLGIREPAIIPPITTCCGSASCAALPSATSGT